MAEKFQKLVKHTKLQIQKPWRTPNKKNTKTCIYFKLLKTKDKEKILKKAREIKYITEEHGQELQQTSHQKPDRQEDKRVISLKC